MDWNNDYYQELCGKFESITSTLEERISAISDGSKNPNIEDLAIGSAKKYRASVLFFDICSFSKRVYSAKTKVLNDALKTLDVLMPILIKIIFDFGGYVEKNTGDGLMAILGVGCDDYEISNNTLNSITTMKYVINNLVNPYLEKENIDPIKWRFSTDLGNIYISRIGSSRAVQIMNIVF
jgi:hypothetical protein